MPIRLSSYSCPIVSYIGENMKITYSSLDELDVVARDIIAYAGDCRVWQFHGEMGAGKTTLIKQICKHLGVIDNTSSPTFALINVYMTRDNNEMYHFDFYRIEKEEEAENIGCEEYFYSGSYCFIEWPERIPAILPAHNLKISINLDGKNRRIISLTRNE